MSRVVQAKICAAATGFDWHDLLTCVDGAQGTALYKASVEFTAAQMAAKIIPACESLLPVAELRVRVPDCIWGAQACRACAPMH